MTETETQTSWYSEDAATFGDRLAAAREQAGFDQATLAAQLGVKTSTIAAWEQDLKEPRANRLTMLSGLLGITLSWLMTGHGEGPDEPEEFALIKPGVNDILKQVRSVRAEISDASDRLARLEKQLRKAIQEPV